MCGLNSVVLCLSFMKLWVKGTGLEYEEAQEQMKRQEGDMKRQQRW